MRLKKFLKLLKNKFVKSTKDEKVNTNENELTTSWFINLLPIEINKRADVENLVKVLEKLDSTFTPKDFLYYVTHTPKEERELLGGKMIELVDAYLRYELQMTGLMTEFVNTKAFNHLSENSINLLCEYANNNFYEIRKTLNLYRNLINFICQ